MIGTPKWREPLIDPFNIAFSNKLKLKSIEGYPHAGNDVFECNGFYNEEPLIFYLKVERQEDADINNEVEIIKRLQNSLIPVPKILDFNINRDFSFIATETIIGDRLSTILSKEDSCDSLKKSLMYMKKFGESLGKIHSLNIQWKQAKMRRFHGCLPLEKITEDRILKIANWLNNNEPKEKEKVFIHGDHHYANLLWNNDKIAAVLDWELCGIGWKEFDIAWSLILRPSQSFLKTKEEQISFLEGYETQCPFNIDDFNYCKVLIYLHFYDIGKNIGDINYTEFVYEEMEKITL